MHLQICKLSKESEKLSEGDDGELYKSNISNILEVGRKTIIFYMIKDIKEMLEDGIGNEAIIDLFMNFKSLIKSVEIDYKIYFSVFKALKEVYNLKWIESVIEEEYFDKTLTEKLIEVFKENELNKSTPKNTVIGNFSGVEFKFETEMTRDQFDRSCRGELTEAEMKKFVYKKPNQTE